MHATIVEGEDIDDSRVYFGATVTLLNVTQDKQLQYTLVSKPEANLSQGKISIESPVGKALLGKCVGEECEVTIPAGTMQYKILKIER